MRLHLQPHHFSAERSRELLFNVISSDARRNACLQEHSDEAAHEPQRGEVSEARNPPESDKKRGDPSHSFGMTQGTGVLPRHSRKEKCLLAGAFRRSGARAPKGRSTDMGGMPACRSIPTKRRTSPKGAKLGGRKPLCHSEAKRGIPSQGTEYKRRGDPSTSLRSVFGMTYKEKAPSLRAAEYAFYGGAAARLT